MTSMIMFGHSLSHIYQGDKEPGVEQLKTIEGSSTQCFGSCEQELLGEICLLSMGIGKTHTEDSLAGETRESGENYLSY
jgi:hypothetical protein